MLDAVGNQTLEFGLMRSNYAMEKEHSPFLGDASRGFGVDEVHRKCIRGMLLKTNLSIPNV